MNILIAYDGSESARGAIADLASAGLPEKTAAVVITAADILPGLIEAKSNPNERVPRALVSARANAATAMAAAEKLAADGSKLVSGLFPAWQVSGEAIADSSYWALVNRANSSKTDLIVLGSRGHSTVQSFVLGSVSQNALHYANCSVRIGRAEGSARAAGAVKNLVAFDGSPSAAAAVSAVASRSWPRGSEARILTAAHGRTLWKLFEDSGSDGEVPAMVEKVADQLRLAGLTVTTAVREDDPKDAILDEAKKWGAHCIFIGARGLTSMERAFLGTVAGTVAARAHCSVEVVRVAT